MKKNSFSVKSLSPSMIMVIISDIIFLLLIPDILAAVICCLISTVSYFLLSKKRKEEIEKLQKKKSSLSFLSSFFLGLYNGQSGKESFDLSSRYLIGYQNVLTYEQVFQENQMPYGLEDYKQYFDYAIEKESQMEAHLPNYFFLRNKIEKSIEDIDLLCKENEEKHNKHFLIMTLILFMFATFVSLFPSISEYFGYDFYVILSVLTLGALFPSGEYLSLNELTRRSSHVQ